MHQAVILIFFAGSLALVYNLTALLAYLACDIKVKRFALFVSKPCITLPMRRIPIDIGFIPWGSCYVTCDNEAFGRLPLRTRLLVLFSPPLMLLVTAILLLPHDVALRHFVNGFAELIRGGLAPYERGVPLIRAFFSSTDKSMFVGYGIFAAKYAAMDMFPLYDTRGNRILAEVLGLKPDSVITLHALEVFLFIPLAVSWFCAFARYAQINPFLLAAMVALPYAGGYVWTRVTRKQPQATVAVTEVSKGAFSSFTLAADAFRAAFEATVLSSNRASHREAIVIAREALENAPAGDINARKAYEDAVARFNGRSDFDHYTEAELDAHTSALDKLTAAFEGLLVAYAGNSCDDNSTDEVFTSACKTYTCAAIAYSKAAACATSDAKEMRIQVGKAKLDGNERETLTAGPANADAMGRVSRDKSRDAEAERKYSALLCKADTAGARAKAAVARAKVAEEAFTTAARKFWVKPRG